MPYIPNTDEDRKLMLAAIGVKSFEELLAGVPEGARTREPLAVPAALSEPELMREIDKLASENRRLVCFAGGGLYDHYIPQVVASLVSRPEFMTAYTPYQPEVSQGTLQIIYEFQTHICRLTGMDVANASMYDGATAAAEAVLTAISHTERKKVILSETLSPIYHEVIRSYVRGFDGEVVELPHADGVTDLARLTDLADDQTACFIVSQPNFFGCLEDVERAAELAHSVGALMIVVADPISLAVVRAPGEQGADMVVGEGQPLGIPMSYGGPLLGFFAMNKSLIRKLPGRLAARTEDVDGRTGFMPTLQTREQHIKRAKATSNICTNQALCATAATIYLSLVGKTGLKRIAELSLERAHYAAKRIAALDGFALAFPQSFHREFAVRCPAPAREIVAGLAERGVLPGVALGRFKSGWDNLLLVALTEKRNYAEIDRLVHLLGEFVRDRVPHGEVEEPCA
ncbi:MAG TPA: aminomethyl-transferring glycine dehydrogenase subunit GcvPA [candidate division Zixibacteria bacterium]|nr:aminomethyl-transferring glycine dehydrogenase subunit GcvPA [candidate division Zixibacteria bacterium]